MINDNTTSLEITKITILQTRCSTNLQKVEDYAELIKTGVVFPPPVIFHDGKSYFSADGVHRIKAHEYLGHVIVAVDLRDGTERDATLFSIVSNSQHGLQRTSTDKRKVVEIMLNDNEWSQWSQTIIAEKCGVTQQYVSKIAKDFKNTTGCMLTTGKDGKIRDTSRIGKSSEDLAEILECKSIIDDDDLPEIDNSSIDTSIDFNDDTKQAPDVITTSHSQLGAGSSRVIYDFKINLKEIALQCKRMAGNRDKMLPDDRQGLMESVSAAISEFKMILIKLREVNYVD